MKLQTAFSSGVALLVAGIHAPVAQAQDDVACAVFAAEAAKQFQDAREYQCEMSPLWDQGGEDRAGLFEWCMAGNPHQDQLRDRRDALRECRGLPPIDARCDDLAVRAVSQDIENLSRSCGFWGENWVRTYDEQYEACIAHEGGASFEDMLAARGAELDRNCATGTGDLVALDWCHVIHAPPGGGNMEIEFRPMIYAHGPFTSKAGGSYSVAPSVGSTVYSDTRPLAPWPLWQMRARETKILPGPRLPFHPDNVYAGFGDWDLTHADDVNAANDGFRETSTGPAARVRDFQAGGRFAAKQCGTLGQFQDCDAYTQLALFQNALNVKSACGKPPPVWSDDGFEHAFWCNRVSRNDSELGSIGRAAVLRDECSATQASCTPKMNVTIRLRRIDVLDEGDGPGDAEPYLFPYFLKLDPAVGFEALTGANFLAPGGSHGNLGAGSWDAGEEIVVPSEIGRWRTTLSLWPEDENAQGYAGDQIGIFAIALLSEEDRLPASPEIPGIYADVEAEFRNQFGILGPLFESMIPGHNEQGRQILSNVIWHLSQTRAEEKEGEYEVPLALLSAFGPPGLGIVVSEAADDLIGATVVGWSWDRLSQSPLHTQEITFDFNTGSRDGAFRLVADVVAEPFCEPANSP